MSLADLTPDQLEQLANAIYSSNKPLNLGPFILGGAIDAVLCGILLMQCGSYISLSARDGWLLKITVTYVIAMNLWSTAFAWAWVWELFVRNFGTYRAFLSVKYLSWASAINAATVFAVQMFFALRAWKMLDRNRVFGAVLFILMLISVGSGLTIKVMFTQQSYTICAGALKLPVYICLCSTVIVDAAITITILWRLQSWRGATRRTNHLLKKLMQITFESQLPPTLIAIAILAVYTIRYDSFVMVPLIWLQPKMYGISLLHTLNIRPTIAQPTVVFGTIYSAPSCTTSNDGRRFTVALAGTAQTEPNLISHNNTAGASRGRSHFSTQNEPPKPTVVSFDEESVLTTPGDTLTVDVIPMVSHRRSSDVEMEMVERNSKLPDSESRPPTAG